MFRNILFDLDGTLTDPWRGITGGIRYALREMGVDPPAPRELLWCIGPPLQESFARLLATDDREQTWQAIERYRDYYMRQGIFENEPYAGIAELLAALQRADKQLFVATSKPHVMATQILKHFQLDRYFVAVYGAELDGARSDKSELIRYLLDREGLAEAESVMVGDRLHDIHGAHSCAVHAVGVTYGYGGISELRNAEADTLCASPQELLRFLSAEAHPIAKLR